MDFQTISLILSTLFGGTGVISLIQAKRERKAQASIVEANATIEMQKGYAQFVIDTNQLIAGLRNELQSVKDELINYQRQCKECSLSKVK